MKKVIIILTIILFLIGCKNTDMQEKEIQNFSNLHIDTFDNLINKGEYTLIDIRNPEELEYTGYINGAINIPYYYPDFIDNIKNLDKNKKYLIYCNSGNRTSHTLNIMKSLGFKESHHLIGGIQSWLLSGKQIQKCNGNIC